MSAPKQLLILNLSSSKSSWDDLWEVWSISTTTRRYIESSFTKPPFSKVFYSNKHGATQSSSPFSLAAGRGSGRKLSLWCFFPAWLMSISVTFCRKGQGSSALYGPHMITKKKSLRIYHYTIILCCCTTGRVNVRNGLWSPPILASYQGSFSCA